MNALARQSLGNLAQAMLVAHRTPFEPFFKYEGESLGCPPLWHQPW